MTTLTIAGTEYEVLSSKPGRIGTQEVTLRKVRGGTRVYWAVQGFDGTYKGVVDTKKTIDGRGVR